MHLHNYVNKLQLEQDITDGFISAKKHPNPKIPLTILNYTHKATFDNHWSQATIRCRGLIYNHVTFEIVVRPPQKFWNLNDAAHPETVEANIRTTHRGRVPTIYEKLDGSMGSLWQYMGNDFKVHWGIATRGSFESEQSQWATKWLNERISNGLMPILQDGVSYIGEIIYPENRIVVNYNFQGWVPFAIIRNDTGEERSYYHISHWAKQNSFKTPRRFFQKWTDLAKNDTDNEEGYVLNFIRDAGNLDWYISFRVKVKFDKYCRLHKILTGFNPKDVWEMLSEGKDFEPLLTDEIPEHFKNWLRKWKTQLEADFTHIEAAAKFGYGRVLSAAHAERKDAAAFVLENYPDTSSIIFAMMDGKSYKDMIWKKIKPAGTDAFREEE